MMKTKLLTCVFVLVALVMANTASAVIVEDFVANGATDPVAQGFLQFAPITTGTHIAASGNGDPEAFQQTDVDSSGGYRLNDSGGDPTGYVAAVEGDEGWTATIQAKLIACGRVCGQFRLQDGSGATATGGNAFEIQFWDGTDFGWPNPGVFYKSDTSNYYDGVRIGAAWGEPGAIDPTDGFHTYQISMDAGGTAASVDNTDDRISIYVDGVLQVGPLPRSNFASGGEYEFLIGRTGGANPPMTSTIQYANFSLETGHIGAIIPEPSTLMLLASGLLGLVGSRRRSKSPAK